MMPAASPHACGRTVLIGMRASGKSTVGRALAARRGVPFIDLDDLVQAEFPEATVHEIWSVHGEPAWRDAEMQVVRRVLCGGPQQSFVLALGGGVPVISEANRLLGDLQAKGEIDIVYLRAKPDTLRGRLEQDAGDRPALTGAGTSREVESVLRERSETYEKLAGRIIDVDDRSIATILDEVEGE